MHTRPQNIYTVTQALKSEAPMFYQQNGVDRSDVTTVNKEKDSNDTMTWLLGTFAATGVFAGLIVVSQYYLDAKTYNDDTIDQSDP